MAENRPVLSNAEISTILENWQQFTHEGSLTSSVSLEKACVEIKELKSAAVARRKNLNEITKLFRSKNKEDQVNMMTEILKAYQEEIDHLSRRSKFSEGAFTGLVKTLNDTPDPCAAIESLLFTVTTGSVHSLEIERLRGELKQYDEEFQQLKNQDITIRRLEDQLQEFKDQNEVKVADEVATRVGEVEQQAERRISEVKEAQRTSEKRLAAAIESMKQAQHSADRAQTQLFEVSTQVERRVSSLMSENSMLAEGTQRLNLRIAETEAEISTLKKTVNQQALALATQSAGDASSTKAGETEDGRTLQLMVAELREELRKQEDQLRSEKQRLEGLLRDAHQQLVKEKEVLNGTRQELAERPSREDHLSIRRQLKSLQRIAFNVQDDEDDSLSLQDPENTLMGERNQLEALLTGRMKALETELTDCRRELSEARQHELAAKETSVSLKKALENSSALITRLESDLECKVTAYEDRHAPKLTNGSMELAELLGVAEPVPSSHSTGHLGVSNKEPNSATGGASSNQMVNILQTQRDRYKDKLTQSEANLLKLQQKVDAAEAGRAQLETDNLSLYSKIRFLQTGAGGGGAKTYTSPRAMRISKPSRSTASSLASVSMNMGRRLSGYGVEEGRRDEDDDEESGGGDVEGRYHQLYEQRMNPFAEFSQHEKQRKLQELSVADRIVLNTTMAIVSHQIGRTFLLTYLGLMHLLVFVTIYYSAHRVSSYGCDPRLDHHNLPPASST